MDLMEAETMELLASRFHLEGGNMNSGIIQVRVCAHRRCFDRFGSRR